MLKSFLMESTKSKEEEPGNEEDKQAIDDVEYNAELYIYNQLVVHD